MRISASIYANGHSDILQTVRMLESNHVDMLHIDCTDEPAVFDDLAKVKTVSTIPLDLHLISAHPLDYAKALETSPVDYLTVQYEPLNGSRELPARGFRKLGLALTSDTPLEAFAEFADRCDFVLLMATEPGVSGGTFNKQNFRRIRDFKRMFPTKQVHVDGGVNAEVSFILRNLGVHCAVSGSYLFNEKSVGRALQNLRTGETDSHFRVADFMLNIDETPTVAESELSLYNILQSIDAAQLAFTTITDESGKLVGIVSNADVRKGLLRHIDSLDQIDIHSIVNRSPIVGREDMTVTQLLRFIREQTVPINYLPVIDAQGLLTGALTFNDLIKGEA